MEKTNLEVAKECGATIEEGWTETPFVIFFNSEESFNTCISRICAKKDAEIERLENIEQTQFHLNERLICKLAELHELKYELMGIAADVDSGKEFDEVCRNTLQRVIIALHKIKE